MKRRIAGTVLIIAALLMLGFWEFWGRENLSYVPILVLRQNAGRNTVITEEMLAVRQVETPPENALQPEDKAKLLGLETVQFVPADNALYPEFFQDPALGVGGDTGKYILSIPNQWLLSYPQTLRRGDEVFFYCGGRLVTSAVVAYARDSSNQEVVSEDDERLRASSTVSLVEVVVDKKTALTLGKLADKGKQFVLLYD